MAELFFAFMKVGVLAFGGGYAALALIQQQVVEHSGWLSMEAFSDLVAIAEMTPGPILINAATFVGMRVCGVPGAFSATLGAVFPSALILSLLSFAYLRFGNLRLVKRLLCGLRPAVVVMIAVAGMKILLLTLFPGGPKTAVDPVAAFCFALALYALRRLALSPILVMLLSGVIGAALHLIV